MIGDTNYQLNYRSDTVTLKAVLEPASSAGHYFGPKVMSAIAEKILNKIGNKSIDADSLCEEYRVDHEKNKVFFLVTWPIGSEKRKDIETIIKKAHERLIQTLDEFERVKSIIEIVEKMRNG